MIFIYGHEAAWLYQITFSDWRQRSHPTLAVVYCCVTETGFVAPQTMDRGRLRSVQTLNHEEHILQAVRNDSGIHTHQVTLACCTSHSTAWKVLQEQLLHLYHLQCGQSLSPFDHSPQENICWWFIAQTANLLFVSSILFTVEATFGITNLHNQHLYTDQNPHGTIQARHQHQFTINVWAGIVGDCLVCSYALPACLTEDVYRDFILNTLPALLEDVPLIIQRCM